MLGEKVIKYAWLMDCFAGVSLHVKQKGSRSTDVAAILEYRIHDVK